MALTTHPPLVPRLKKEYSHTSTLDSPSAPSWKVKGELNRLSFKKIHETRYQVQITVVTFHNIPYVRLSTTKDELFSQLFNFMKTGEKPGTQTPERTPPFLFS
jgi:hypothetical protein